jgi:gamma-glutamyltranspeptidase
VVQVLLRILWFEDEPYEAVQRTRIHHQWQPNAVYLEGDTKQTHIASHLRKLGHSHLDRKDIGIVQVILVENGLMKPYSDLRKGGKSFGY